MPLLKRRAQVAIRNLSKIKQAVEKSKEYPVGRRIITIGSYIKTLNVSASHARICKNPSLFFEKELRSGLRSRMLMACKSCKWSEWICTDEKEDEVTLPVNDALVWGTNAGGSHFESVKELMTVLDIPFPSHDFYFKHEQKVILEWDEALLHQLEVNGVEEAKAAREAGDTVLIAGNEYPCTGVYADGGWSTRSYGHSCKSKGGVAVLIGARTNKLLHIGIKNMFCIICKRSSNLGVSPSKHVCYKNWEEDASATQMETAIIVEGFQSSIRTHGLVYNKLIADGDASVYATLRNSGIYPGVVISKAECVNHVVKNVNKALIKLTNETGLPNVYRKMLKNNIQRFGKSLRCAIQYRNQNSDQHLLLRSDIMNIPFHTFGQHEKCATYFSCKRKDQNLVDQLQGSVLWKKLLDHFNRVAFMSERLLPNFTSNIAESFMSRLAKHNHGKRLNVIQRLGWHSKATAAALSFNNGKAFYTAVFNNLRDRNPSRRWIKSAERSRKIIDRSKKHDLIRKTRFRMNSKQKPVNDKFYGPCATAPDLEDSAISFLISNLKLQLQVTTQEQLEIMVSTKEQSLSDRWFEERTHRITASVAGDIFSLKNSTNNSVQVRKLLYPKTLDHLEAIKHGRLYEQQAVRAYEQLRCTTVQACGLIVSTEQGIFAVSPDGLVGDDGLIEVKCPATLVGYAPTDMPKVMKSSFLKPKNALNTGLELMKSHKYYKQVVMLLHVTQRSWCDFIVYSFKIERGVQAEFVPFVQRIMRDGDTAAMWEKMKSKLLKFYEEDLAPEIVNSRVSRGLSIRQPTYRAEAMSLAESKKVSKRKAGEIEK